MTTTRRETYSPVFWAFLLIALGVMWLLFQAHIFSSANLIVLLRLWPIALIALGLELLIGRGSRATGLLIGAGTILLLLALMAAGPALGLAPSTEVKTFEQSVPLQEATSAQMNLDLSVGRATVQALDSDSATLIDADLSYVGIVNFNVSGNSGEKFVTLSVQNDSSSQIFDFLGLSLGQDQLHWNVGLTPRIPLDLRLNGGVGDSTVNLSGLQLTRLSYNTGVGNSAITLPGSGSYAVSINGGVGDTTVTFAAGAAVKASINGGVGDLTLSLPEGAPIHLETHGGLGSVHVPATLNRVGGDDRGGVWETASYASSSDAARITISYTGGVGDLNVR